MLAMKARPSLPTDLVVRSLDEAARFAETLVPMLRRACHAAKEDVRRVPEGGERCPEAELQLFPAFVRGRMHQIIAGHNARAEKPLEARHIRNGAVCLLCHGQEFRLLKDGRSYPTRPTGRYQERLVNQDDFWERRSGQGTLLSVDPPLLRGLIYYRTQGYELQDAFVVIPNGFDEEGVVIEARRDLIDLERAATFRAAEPIAVLGQGEDLVVVDGPLPADDYDPYEEADEFEPQGAFSFDRTESR